MTAIICIHDPKTGQGAIAADSCMTGYVVMQSKPKIRQLDAYHVGSSGSLLGGMFIDQGGPWAPYLEKGQAYDPYMEPGDLQRFASRWRAWCKERGHIEVEAGCTRYASHFVMIGPGGIFELSDDGEVFRHVAAAVAIGSGSQVAIGAAHALRLRGLGLERVATIAIEAAIKYCDGCEGPVQVVSVKTGDIPYTEDLTKG